MTCIIYGIFNCKPDFKIKSCKAGLYVVTLVFMLLTRVFHYEIVLKAFTAYGCKINAGVVPELAGLYFKCFSFQ